MNNEKNITGKKPLEHKKPTLFMKFMKWIEKGQQNKIQCTS